MNLINLFLTNNLIHSNYKFFIDAKDNQKKENVVVAHFLEYMRELHSLEINYVLFKANLNV